MTWPDLPTQLSGNLIVTKEIDAETSSNIVRHKTGAPAGVWLDDTEPNRPKWEALAIEKFIPLRQQVFILVAPLPNETARSHHYAPMKGLRFLLEVYPDHAGVPASAFFPFREDFRDIIVQYAYPGLSTQWLPEAKWPLPPTSQRRRQLVGDALGAMGGNRDRVWLF